MKRSLFGIILFIVGSIGFLILSLYLSAHPHSYNSLSGLPGALLGNDLLLPYIVFCVFGLVGLVICIYEAYIRK